jgi:hypothetical protein
MKHDAIALLEGFVFGVFATVLGIAAFQGCAADYHRGKAVYVCRAAQMDERWSCIDDYYASRNMEVPWPTIRAEQRAQVQEQVENARKPVARGLLP